VTTLSNVGDWGLRPICLVEEENILLYITAKRDNPLGVGLPNITFMTVARPKIKHIP